MFAKLGLIERKKKFEGSNWLILPIIWAITEQRETWGQNVIFWSLLHACYAGNFLCNIHLRLSSNFNLPNADFLPRLQTKLTKIISQHHLTTGHPNMNTKPQKIKWRPMKNQNGGNVQQGGRKNNYHSFCEISFSTETYLCKVTSTKTQV